MRDIVQYQGVMPRRQHESDAACDLEADTSEPYTIQPGDRAAVPCGFAVAIPPGYVGLVCSRSGMAIKHGVFVLNAPGVIDPGYRGEVKAILMNLGAAPFRVNPGDRIAQLLIVPALTPIFSHHTHIWDAATDRGSNGFGSTGR